MTSAQRKIYFTAGPAKIPDEVMEQVAGELLDYNGCGISILEVSHRSREFEAIINEAETNLRKLLHVPENYSILFMHGGAKTQFSSVPMNLCSELDKHQVDYIINGSWSKMAADEAEKYASVNRQSLEDGSFIRAPKPEELKHPGQATYRYYCDNETIQGIEFDYVPESSPAVDLVADMTSNFLSRPVDVSKFGVIFAGAQKNCGIAGLAIVVVRKDLLGKHMRITSKIQSYEVMDKNKSLYNTPLTFAIYIANLCFKWMLARGGLVAMNDLCLKKSGLLYDYIDNSGGFYINSIPKNNRSRLNVIFLLKDKSLEPKFLDESKAANLYELRGHRTVGGFRASLYHGIRLEDVQRLIKFMAQFRAKNS